MSGFPYTLPLVFLSSANEIQIQSRYPQITAQSLFTFIDFQYETQSNSYYTKEFRYSLNGGTSWTAYETLNETNVRAMSATIDDNLRVEVRKIESTTPDITGDSVKRGNYSRLINPKFENTFFSNFFNLNDDEIILWAINVLEKLYERGILPFYLDRNAGNSLWEDEDFISLFFTITHFYGILVTYARQFESITTNEDLLRSFLDSVGVYYKTTSEIADLQILFNTYISEIEKRGTTEIYRKLSDGANIDGELLRLVDYDQYDEFIFALLRQREIGWVLGTASPMYKGTEDIINLNKAYENTEEVVDLNKYPLIESSYISIDGGTESMLIASVPPATESGVADNGDTTKRIIIEPKLTYEIGFKIKNSSDVLSGLSFGVNCFDQYGIALNCLNHNLGTNENYFFRLLNITPSADTWYWVRGVIYSSDLLDDPTDQFDIYITGSTRNLRFPSNAKYIVPIITYSNFSTNTYIKDIKIRPYQLPWSQGSLGVKNQILNYIKNNTGTNNDTITQTIKNLLVPYNCVYEPYYLNDL